MSKLEKAQNELDAFLKKHPQPHRQEQQKKIKEILAKTPEDKKVEVLFIMLGQKYVELIEHLNKLSTTIH